MFGEVEIAELLYLGLHVRFGEAWDVRCADVALRHFGEEGPLRETAFTDEEERGVGDGGGGVAFSWDESGYGGGDSEEAVVLCCHTCGFLLAFVAC